jgi:anaerobic ribonucleoside-triphosphate reductase activating protein
MNISGFQKLSLLDYPKTPCAILFTQGCSFRCAFCHNPELIPMTGAMSIPPDEVIAKLEANRKMVDAVTVTGGEPTLQSDLPEFMKELKNRGFKVKLDTNGVTPAMVKELIDDGAVDYIAMDLKQTWEKYDEVVRVGAPGLVDRARETFDLIQNSKVDHEFRTTILPHSHTEEDFITMVGYLIPGEKYFIQETRFDITLEPNLPRQKSFNTNELVAKLRAAYPEILIDSR